MPFLLNYGIVDFIGSLMEPLMRPVFKTPGRSSCQRHRVLCQPGSVGVLITSKLYQRGIYHEKGSSPFIATGLQRGRRGISVHKVIETADLFGIFPLPIYFLSRRW
ncbi:MAG: hypothetical protein ACLR0U_29165 [Enterocloster clostridioformis]